MYYQLFELLDSDKSGMISAHDVTDFLKSVMGVKQLLFEEAEMSEELDLEKAKRSIALDKRSIEMIVNDLDFTGRRSLSPDQFYNIIMSFYSQ